MRKLAAGNWKMNGLKADGLALARDIVGRAKRQSLTCDLLLCPPATLLAPVAEAIAGSSVALGGQNCHAASSGAHTGEISAPMLKDAGCAYVILGHSERRTDQGETDAEVQAKVVAVHKVHLCSIVCIGETLAQRDAGETLAVIERQIAGSLPEGLDSNALVIAYEPVWAIGTGRTPTVGEVAEVHDFMRKTLAIRFAGEAAGIRLLYGGSGKPSNAAELLAVSNVNGALIGGASLKATDFLAIAGACP